MNSRRRNYSEEMQGTNVANCSAKPLGKSNLVECLTEGNSCSWRQLIGSGVFCAHTLNFMIAQETLLSGRAITRIVAESGHGT